MKPKEWFISENNLLNNKTDVIDMQGNLVARVISGVEDAALIVTAPEMLEMLYELLPYAEESDEFNKPSHKIGPRVLALIAKAEGR